MRLSSPAACEAASAGDSRLMFIAAFAIVSIGTIVPLLTVVIKVLFWPHAVCVPFEQYTFHKTDKLEVKLAINWLLVLEETESPLMLAAHTPVMFSKSWQVTLLTAATLILNGRFA